MKKHIPNILSLFRFVLIPIILNNIYTQDYLAALLVFTLSAITDIADGFIARKFNLVSNLGKLLDPLADKITQICIIAMLVITRMIPPWILLILMAKELILICGATFLYGKNIVVYSKWYGKLATVLLYLAIVGSLLLKQFNVTVGILINIDFALYCFAIFCTVFALIMYIKALYSKGFINKSDLNKDLIKY
ncbi:MAG: CDP-diacylglycerol--glycerol-3-phosphate 3-phosphatidyltransferase [Clostridia bacterium]|nr:CDP-diacylglycerol--glycerol-3-phosphate 3-phosphatidyltransferase [Clostridia bacterium]